MSSACLSILGHPFADLLIGYFFLEYGNTQERVLLWSHPKEGQDHNGEKDLVKQGFK